MAFGTATITAYWVNPANADDKAYTPTDASLYNNQSTTITLKGKGNVKLMNNSHGADLASNQCVIKVTVTNGDLVVSCDTANQLASASANVATINFRVNTNNADGAEYVKSGDALEAKGTVISTSAASTAGNAKYDSTTEEISVYVAGDTNDWIAQGTYMHSMDGFDFAA